LLEEWKESNMVSIYKTRDKTDCSNYRGILSVMFKILSNILLSRLTPYAGKFLVIINVDFDATGKILTVYSAFVKYLRKNWNPMKQFISYL
jgi:hypothetical protein